MTFSTFINNPICPSTHFCDHSLCSPKCCPAKCCPACGTDCLGLPKRMQKVGETKDADLEPSLKSAPYHH